MIHSKTLQILQHRSIKDIKSFNSDIRNAHIRRYKLSENGCDTYILEIDQFARYLMTMKQLTMYLKIVGKARMIMYSKREITREKEVIWRRHNSSG